MDSPSTNRRRLPMKKTRGEALTRLRLVERVRRQGPDNREASAAATLRRWRRAMWPQWKRR
jgi:hypothetical protein